MLTVGISNANIRNAVPWCSVAPGSLAGLSQAVVRLPVCWPGDHVGGVCAWHLRDTPVARTGELLRRPQGHAAPLRKAQIPQAPGMGCEPQ